MYKIYLTFNEMDKSIREEMDSIYTESSRDYAYFSVKNAGFLICHGNKDGKFRLNGERFTTHDFLDKYHEIYNALGVSTIYTISCYGGFQSDSERDGCTIKSLHSSHERVSWKYLEGDEGRGKLRFTIKLETSHEVCDLREAILKFGGKISMTVWLS